jgi:hypothetical protein
VVKIEPGSVIRQEGNQLEIFPPGTAAGKKFERDAQTQELVEVDEKPPGGNRVDPQSPTGGS